MKILVCVDMQKDFISGSLANVAAQEIVAPMAEYIKTFAGPIIFTQDTHQNDYLETYEGKHLPVEHCIEYTEGWTVDQRLINAARQNVEKSRWSYFKKPTFGYATALAAQIKTLAANEEINQIEFCGTCTDICLITNVLGLKEHMPDVDIIVHGNLCAGLSREAHDAALMVMKSCQVKVV